MRLKKFIADVISEIQDGVEDSLYIECDDFNVEFDIAVTEADEEGIYLAVTLPNDTGNRISFSVPIKSYKTTKGGNS